MRHNVLLLFYLIIMSLSCASDNSISAGKKVAILMMAEDCSVGIEKLIDSEKGKKNFITLKLINIKGDFVKMPFEKSTSFAAINFHDNLSTEDCEGVNGIKIILESDSSSEDMEFSFKDLKAAKKCYKIVENFFSNFNNTENKFSLIDTSYMSKEQVLDLSSKTAELGLQNADGISFAGFRFAHLDINNKACTTIWVHKKNNGTYLKYTFYVLKETNKIIYIKVE